MRDKSEHIVMGRVSGCYGVRGWLKIQSFTRPPLNILSYTPWQVQRDRGWQELALLEGKAHGKGLIVRLEGVTNRDEARSLLSADIAIWRSQLHATGPGDYYWDDLLDMEVVNQEGKRLGSVTGVMETGANDVLIVEGSERHLIPLVWTIYVQDIDLPRKTIRVDWA